VSSSIFFTNSLEGQQRGGGDFFSSIFLGIFAKLSQKFAKSLLKVIRHIEKFEIKYGVPEFENTVLPVTCRMTRYICD